MSVIQVKRGEIYYANLDPVVGRETGKLPNDSMKKIDNALKNSLAPI